MWGGGVLLPPGRQVGSSDRRHPRYDRHQRNAYGMSRVASLFRETPGASRGERDGGGGGGGGGAGGGGGRASRRKMNVMVLCR